MALICGVPFPPVFDARATAARYGIAIELTDLGDWGAATLIGEYDPHGPVIRINERAIERYRAACGNLTSCDVRLLIDFAVAHELYHHREAIGEIARLPTLAQREAAADGYARSQLLPDAQLDAFLNARA